jgi:hypothetical protein
MGIEILKVTGKIVKDSKGQKANLLKYAYKFNSLLSFAEDAQVQFKTGCSRASHYVETSPNFTGRVTDGEGQTSFNWNRGTISDYKVSEEQYEAEKEDREYKHKVSLWLKDNPQVGILCVKGKEVYYVIRDHKEVRIDPLTQL